ncbi:hypothetical protein OG306_33120 [Streptomyces sp. NBC_01241]|uniref:hypothetical protein n=1 Tax=Streptomyces sp. NBC_01241 TaxID=2903794 RepID=UPI00352CEA1E|nr:hypothetical protein OG306_33120 [Streptomyces sp. NBC_01241]
MSAMKRYADDVQELTLRATGIAWNPYPKERSALFEELYSDCVKAADVYADPVAVSLLLMHEVAEAYAEAFNAQKEVSA